MFTVQDLKKLPPEKVKQVLSELTPQQLEELQYDWKFWGRPEQQEPKGNWKIWLPLAGRGWGKTRCGAEWVRHRIKSGDRRIACVAPTKGDVRRVMVEGESGLLNICWKGDKTYRGAEMGFPVWSPTNNSVTWANGAKAEFFSAEDPERLRGPQFHSAWCDEICLISSSYVETDSGLKTIDSITKKDKVLTRFGYKQVLDAWHTGKRDTWKITTKTGKTLQGTFDHPVMTPDGWKSLGKLKAEESILVLSGMENVGTKPNTITSTEQENFYTEKSTNLLTGLSQKVSTFTTSMKTKVVMTWKILKHFLSQNTLQNILLEDSCKTLTQGSGQGHSGITKNLKSSFARSVAHVLNQLAQEQDFAVNHVRTDTITNVEKAGREDVYNITVKDCHEYFANGILNHNCAWTRMQETWDMLQFTLRLGKNPRILVTTTPKPVKLLRSIIKPENIASGRVYKTSGSSYENSDNIDLEALSQYEGTRLGRQELYAEILDEAAGALWNRKMIDDAQFDLPEDCIVKDEDGITVNFDASRKEFAKKLVKVVVSVDPAITSNEESDLTGIMVAGIDINGNAYILEDATDRYMPEQWAAKAISLYNEYEADLIVAERNQGGDMVRSTLRTVDDTVPIKMVHASRGKYARAEPVSSLYERGKVKHLKYLEDLEEQMVTWEPLGSIGSPDRLDAMVWAVTNLLLKGYAQAPIKISYGKTINF